MVKNLVFFWVWISRSDNGTKNPKCDPVPTWSPSLSSRLVPVGCLVELTESPSDKIWIRGGNTTEVWQRSIEVTADEWTLFYCLNLCCICFFYASLNHLFPWELSVSWLLFFFLQLRPGFLFYYFILLIVSNNFLVFNKMPFLELWTW